MGVTDAHNSDAGGGGERVLWTAIAALQREIPNVICAVYTGDSASDEAIMQAAQQRFGIRLPRPVHFVRLKRRHLLEDRQYPRFTLLMQSIGSMRVAVDALAQLVPDVYIGPALLFSAHLNARAHPLSAFFFRPVQIRRVLPLRSPFSGFPGAALPRTSTTRPSAATCFAKWRFGAPTITTRRVSLRLLY